MGFLTWLKVQWDRAAAVAFAALGLVCLLLGWLGASGTPHLAVQVPYFISGGLTGIFLAGLAAMMWLSADMRDEWRELRRLRVLLENEQSNSATGDAQVTALTAVAPTGSEYPDIAVRRPRRRTRAVASDDA
jgi:hypothetical protein